MFIVLEGIDGSGKSSRIPFIKSFLESHSMEVIETREPGGTLTGEQIRNIFLRSDHLLKETELLLLCAARIEHIEKVIKPSLRRGKTVLCDRYIDSTYAYQGEGLSLNTISQLEKTLVHPPNPDLTILFDVDPEVVKRRLANREVDRVEKMDITFYERVRNRYLARANLNPERYLILDASKTEQEIEDYLSSRLIQQINNYILKTIKYSHC